MQNARHIMPTEYSVTWYELPAGVGVKDALAAVRAGELRDAAREIERERARGDEAESVTQRPVNLGGEAGMELGIRLHREYLTTMYLDQSCAHRGRVYRVTLSGNLDAASKRVWLEMLHSFRFTS